MDNKGQTALEFIANYGWVLVIILVVALALFALGVLNPATYQGHTCTGFGKFGYQDHAYDGSTFWLELYNGEGQPVNITDMNVTLDSGATGHDANSIFMAPAELKIFSAPVSNPPGAYTAEVVLTYTTARDGLQKTAIGNCVGYIGEGTAGAGSGGGPYGTLDVNLTSPHSHFVVGDSFSTAGDITCNGGNCGTISAHAQWCAGATCTNFADMNTTSILSTTESNPKSCGTMTDTDTCSVSFTTDTSQTGFYRVNITAISNDPNVDSAMDSTVPIVEISTAGTLNVNITSPTNGQNINNGTPFDANVTISCTGTPGAYCDDVDAYLEWCSGTGCTSWANMTGSGNLSTSSTNPYTGCGDLSVGESCNITWSVTGNNNGTYRVNILADTESTTVGDVRDPTPPEIDIVTQATGTYNFNTSAQYTYDANYIAFASGMAGIKQKSPWYDTNWPYRKAITVDNTGSAQAFTDFQVDVNVNTAALISAGKMNNDCSDIRFTDNNHVAINFWRETDCNTANTTYWAKVPTIPASSTTTIYAYYGYPSASDASNKEDLSSSTFEFGQITDLNGTVHNGNWQTINLANTYSDMVVIAGPISHNSSSEYEIRLKDVGTTSFKIGIQEADNGTSHTELETVNYIAIEKGAWFSLEDDLVLQVEDYDTNAVHTGLAPDTADSITFSPSFAITPGLFGTIQTYNDSNFVTDVIINPTNLGFDLAMEIAETGTTHGQEEMGWMAAKRVSGVHNGYDYEIDDAANVRGHTNGCYKRGDFSAFSTPPLVLVQMISRNDGNGGWVIFCGNEVENDGFNVHIEEDTVHDSENNHKKENIDYFAIDANAVGFLRKYGLVEPTTSVGLETTLYYTPSYVVTPNSSIVPATVSSWDEFNATETLNGQTIGYQLSDDDGTTWYYWNGSSWTSTIASWNNASTVDSNISSFSTTSGKILVRVQLNSNGAATPYIDNVDIVYTV